MAAAAAALVPLGILSAVPNRNPFRFLNQTIGSGPDALRSIVINNEQTGELLQVVHESGGKTAKLMLKDPSYPVVQDVLEPLTDAAAIRDTANGIHYAGSILAPFANRVANGSYTFFGKKYYMPRNECSELRCDALHGFLFNKSLDIIDQSIYSRPGIFGASLTLGYEFDGTEPGWPFSARVRVTYALESGDALPKNLASMLYITIKAVNTMKDSPLPWTTSWHPYFRVADVSAAPVLFDNCNGSKWRHLITGPGAPRKGDLIPTGKSEPWSKYDGSDTSIGGTSDMPTYYDDEFKSTLPDHQPRPSSCAFHPITGDPPMYNVIVNRIGNIMLAGERMAFRTWQVFTGAKEGWGWDAIALEPMSGLADAYNNGDGLTVLNPGEEFEATFAVQLHKP